MSDEQPARTRTRTRTEAPAREPLNIEGNAQTELGATMLQITSRMGAGVIQKASVVPGFCHIETGIFSLDFALLGGIPEGLVTMIYGWESSGKTTTAMRVVGGAQRKYDDKACVWIDAEQTFDNSWAGRHGVDMDRLFIARPESGEHAVDIMDGVLRAKETSLVVLDSLPALVPQAEIDSSAEDSLVAKRSQLIGRMCSKILAATLDQRHKGNFPTVILINQWRMKIGVTKGDPRVLPGGMQPKFLATTMFETKNKEHMGRDSRGTELVDYNEHAFTVKKSKVGNSLRNGEFTMIRDPEHPLGSGGIDDAGTVATYAKRFGLIDGHGGAWVIDGVNQSFRKLEHIVDFLYAEPDEFMILKQRIISMQREFMGLPALPPDGYLCGPWAS